MKILYVTTVGSTLGFFIPFIKELIEQGHQVDLAANERIRPVPQYYHELSCNIYNISCSRSPLKRGNAKAIKELKNIVEEGKYDLVHCHTPIAAACTRIACRKARKTGTKVIYTAHGFHFYTGAPTKNWILYYPMEKWLSKYTDVLVTITKEDYNRASTFFKAKKTIYVPGVGIDLSRFKQQSDEQQSIRTEFSIQDKYVLLSVGELNANKNHEMVIRALAGIQNKENIVYVIVGQGGKKEYLQSLGKELDVNVILTGYRYDVLNFYKAADAFILPSIREGLSVSLMEAMASGLPCLVGRIRGNTDLIDEKGGFLFNPLSIDEIKVTIEQAMNSKELYGEYNKKKIQSFDIREINNKMERIYKEALEGK